MNVREIINATNGILLSGDENLEIIKNAFREKKKGQSELQTASFT